MPFSEKDIALRKLEMDDLLAAAKTSSKKSVSDQVVIGDELLRRSHRIEGLTRKFETLVRSLSTRDLKYIDRYDYAFARATIKCACHELRKRRVKCLNWFYLVDGSQEGPMERYEIEEAVEDKRIGENDSVWKEGDPNWVKLKDSKALKTPYYFDELPPERPRPIPKTPQSPSAAREASGMAIAAGVLQLTSFPFWLIALIVVPFWSLSSSLGLVLPTVFAASALMLTIPVGIGLILKKQWAYGLKLGSGILLICWLISRIVLDEGSMLWMMYILAEVVILVLMISSKESFNTKTYGSVS